MQSMFGHVSTSLTLESSKVKNLRLVLESPTKLETSWDISKATQRPWRTNSDQPGLGL